MDDDATTTRERTIAIIEQLETLEIVARRTMQLAKPEIDGSVARCVMLWRVPSHRIILQTRAGLFNSAELDIELEIRRPRNARRIVVEGASHDSGLLPRPSDPEGSVLRLLTAIRSAAERSLEEDPADEATALLGMILAMAEEKAITDQVWTYRTGSEILGPGRLSSMPENSPSILQASLPATGSVHIETGNACMLSMLTDDPKPISPSSPAPLLCTIKRPGSRIDLGHHGTEAKLRALAAHLGRLRS